jgi:DNA-binding PadR family transcriptional regulator
VAGGAGKLNWMRGSPLKGALLALLLELGEPTHPYLLATLLARRLGPAARVDHDAVYKMLAPLVKAGLVDFEVRENPTGNWQRQRVYRATDLTEDARRRWMSAPLSYEVAREDLRVRIAFSRPSDAHVLLQALDVFEMQCMEQLEECELHDVPMGTWHGVVLNAACDWADEHVRADLSWVMKTREAIRDHAGRPGAT